MSRREHDRRRIIPYASPLMNLGELYGTDRDAVTPYGFTWAPGIHPVLQKEGSTPRVPGRDYGHLFAAGADPLERRRELVRLASYGAAFDDVLFVGAPEDVEQLIRIGFVSDVRDGGTMLGRFVGCQARLRVLGTAAGPTTVVASWQAADRPSFTEEFPGGPPELVALPRASCEGIWVGVFAGASKCADTGENGLVFASTSLDRITDIECRLEPAGTAPKQDP
jgi:hypothetical protein